MCQASPHHDSRNAKGLRGKEIIMQAQTTVVPTQARLPYRHLVPAQWWDRLVRRVVKDTGISFEKAELVVDAAVGFLKLCTDFPGHRFSPSPLVDIGWHTALLYTREYAAFCHQLAGRFLHHSPNDQPETSGGNFGPLQTVGFMKKHGVVFNREVWLSTDKGSCEHGMSCKCDRGLTMSPAVRSDCSGEGGLDCSCDMGGYCQLP